jgi:DNA repair protein SbcD/Mre11
MTHDNNSVCPFANSPTLLIPVASPMRFVHVADVHLDTSFSGRSPAVRRRLRDASREAFRKSVDLAIREDVHALLIAGDLFDGDRLSFTTERFLLEQARRLEAHGITVVYATGNHDPGSPISGPRSLEWPSNVHVAWDDTPRRIQVDDHEGRPVGYVTAIGHSNDREKRDLSRLLPRPEGQLPEVALLHTQVHSTPGAEDHHPYAPSELSYLVRSGYDYWALGHVHIRQELSVDPPVVYAGSLMGRTHTDTGPRGALLVDVSDRDSAAASFRPVSPVRWATILVDHLEDATTLDRLERRVEVAWRALRDAQAAGPELEWMVRVQLVGPCPLWRELRAEENLRVLEHELTGLLGALDVALMADRIHPVIPVGEHRVRADVLGASLRLAEAVRRGETRLADLDPDALAGIAGKDPALVDAYVRELLEDADGEIAARLLGPDSDRS